MRTYRDRATRRFKIGTELRGQPVSHLPDVPGNGLAWDESAIAHYRADP